MNEKILALLEDGDFAKELHREAVAIEITERILEYMEIQGVSRRDLANKMGGWESQGSRIFSSTQDVSLETLADVLFFLNADIRVEIRPKQSKSTTEKEQGE